MTYDHNSIKVLGETIAMQRFGFKRAEELHDRYRWCSLDWCQRLVTACELSGWPLDQAERRYCQVDRRVSPTPEFTAIYQELMDEDRRTLEKRFSGP